MRTSYKILGAGPAGLTAAINLRKKGYNVTVYEKNEGCGGRINGNLQGIENWSSPKTMGQRLDSMNINPSFLLKPFYSTTFMNTERSVEANSKKPWFYLIKRGAAQDSLDQGLRRQAERCGVEIKFSTSATAKDVDIVATGPRAGQLYAIEKTAIFETNLNDMALVLMGNQFAHRGLSYLLVSDGYASLGSVNFGKFGDLEQCFNNTLKKFEQILGIKIKDYKVAGGVAGFSPSPTLVENGKFYIGEAAGLQDAGFGFGVSMSMESGYILSQVVDKPAPEESYQNAIKKRFGNHIKSSVVIRYLLDKMGKNNYNDLINMLRKEEDLRDFFKGFYNFPPISRILYPFLNKSSVIATDQHLVPSPFKV
ncbi:MAG: NAD(P)/FAD-dependent oxidoreductase [Candidatus Micrarchaeota archaeon]|nr:NAD(P)/FAD-dependent oxidoreductase [Candidatus Micrarchaeota archaeon]MDE1847527.1 NAD(P)/FAD-dependent oxidoreductase [Candidatus Micrarchaeota archaeon]MDE1863837.1 NAD(P)/FAD-dependent oxidoreductase [Candidatus Micrarchaeota archaeon]